MDLPQLIAVATHEGEMYYSILSPTGTDTYIKC